VREIDLRFFLNDAPEPLAAKAPVPLDDVPLANKLERVASTALDKIDEVLRLPLPDPSEATFGNVSRAQSAAANSALNAQLRVGEAAMRIRQDDVMPRLIQILEREQRKLTALEQVSQVERIHDEK
jgi:hypothetical protein